MMIKLFIKLTQPSLLFLTLALLSSHANAAELYRWTDDKGKTHYTDRVPPQYMKKGYRVISEQGLTVHTILSTAEEQKQIQQQAEDKDTRSEEEIAYDQRLLATYSSNDEIIANRERKIADIETLITLSNETILLLNSQFRQLTSEASDTEKQGKGIPESLQNKIISTQGRLTIHQDSINKHQQEKIKVRQHFDDDLARFKQLRQSLAPQ